MAKTSVQCLTLRHPMSRQGYENAGDLAEMWESRGYMLHGVYADGERIRVDGETITAGGSVQIVEYRKTLDYNRDERRAAKRSGQELKVNAFKGILPDGYQPIMPDDPRLQALSADP